MTYTIEDFIRTLTDIQEQNGANIRVLLRDGQSLRPVTLEVALVTMTQRYEYDPYPVYQRNPEGDWSLIIG